MAATGLVHTDAAKKTDDALHKEGAAYLSARPALQIVAELLETLRLLSLDWWSPAMLRDAFPTAERMTAFGERPDLRQKITTELTGYLPMAARRMTPQDQTNLIDLAVECGATPLERWESAFHITTLVVYMDARKFWWLFRERMPWNDNAEPHQEIIARLIDALMKERGDGNVKPILTPLDFLWSIDRRSWQTRIPVETRMAIDEAMLALEKVKPNEPFGSKRILSIATPALILRHIPIAELSGIVDAAEQAMGFEKSSPKA
ncbi:hypothetical protein HY479_03895 [Candidatus Uhrbacteria bacterium]|nr:hypothetical protein [Candidatus Uhrbacteria bacterium]